MKILVTGAKGFIGKNLIAELKNRKYDDVFGFDKETDSNLLDDYCKEADFVFHLAGVNRPKEQAEFMEGNFGFTSELLNALKKHQNICPVMISSSIQAELNNPYGESKKAGEDLLFAYSEETGSKNLVYRFPNVFGKWCRPNYNSVVATFCYNIAHGLPIKINNPETELTLVYIDDVVAEFIKALDHKINKGSDGYCHVERVFKVTLQQLADLIYSFSESRKTLIMPNFEDEFERFLYATYLSYLPEDTFGYKLEMKHDNRGWLAEFIKSKQFGQIFISRTKPGITRGNHWHHTKNEKFLVVSGKGVISFRKIDSDEVIEYFVSGDKMEVVDIPTGYVHNITNTGDDDLITIMWANELYNPERPDTHYMEV